MANHDFGKISKPLSLFCIALIYSIFQMGTACGKTNTVKITAPSGNSMFVDINGMTVGGGDRPPVDLIIGLGDTATRVMLRNPYIPTIQVDRKYGFSAVMFNTFKLSIEADDLRFSVPCVRKASYDSLKMGETSVGLKTVQSVSGMLCDRVVDDWHRATQLASQLATQFEKENPRAKPFGEAVQQYTKAELASMSVRYLGTLSRPKLEVVYDESQANAFFKALNQQGGYDDLTRSADAYAMMGIYLSKTGIFWIGITRSFNFGGREKLPLDKRDQMNYQVNFGFDRRLDAPLYPADMVR